MTSDFELIDDVIPNLLEEVVIASFFIPIKPLRKYVDSIRRLRAITQKIEQRNRKRHRIQPNAQRQRSAHWSLRIPTELTKVRYYEQIHDPAYHESWGWRDYCLGLDTHNPLHFENSYKKFDRAFALKYNAENASSLRKSLLSRPSLYRLFPLVECLILGSADQTWVQDAIAALRKIEKAIESRDKSASSDVAFSCRCIAYVYHRAYCADITLDEVFGAKLRKEALKYYKLARRYDKSLENNTSFNDLSESLHERAEPCSTTRNSRVVTYSHKPFFLRRWTHRHGKIACMTYLGGAIGIMAWFLSLMLSDAVNRIGAIFLYGNFSQKAILYVYFAALIVWLFICGYLIVRMYHNITTKGDGDLPVTSTPSVKPKLVQSNTTVLRSTMVEWSLSRGSSSIHLASSSHCFIKIDGAIADDNPHDHLAELSVVNDQCKITSGNDVEIKFENSTKSLRSNPGIPLFIDSTGDLIIRYQSDNYRYTLSRNESV